MTINLLTALFILSMSTTLMWICAFALAAHLERTDMRAQDNPFRNRPQAAQPIRTVAPTASSVGKSAAVRTSNFESLRT
jgi:hypothetical protein